MPRRESYVPKHRSQPEPTRRRGLHLTLSGIAVVATGIAVSSGVALGGGGAEPAVSATLSAAEPEPADLGDRTGSVSRSDRRSPVDSAKAAALDQASGGQRTETEDLTTRDPRAVARAMLPKFGFGGDQFSCLDSLYVGESGWDVHADNPTSSAYGIPQALPGSKMASAGPDWENDAATQIKWGLGYIKARYGTPCSALSFKQGNGWY